MTTIDTPALSREALRLIARCSATGNFVADSRAAVICDVQIRNLTQVLEPAVAAGALRRVRDVSGVLGYKLPVDETGGCIQEQRIATAAPQTQQDQYQRSQEQEKSPVEPQIPKRPRVKAGQFKPLPELDLSKLAVKMAPKYDGRAHIQRCKWFDLFDKLAENDVDGDKLPTLEIPPEYGGAVGASAPDWNRARTDGKRIRISRNKTVTVVQLEMAKEGAKK